MSGDSSAYENYTNSMRDTVSITDIDFGNAIDDDPIPEDIMCKDGGVFNEMIRKPTNLSDRHNLSVPILSLGSQIIQQSEA